MDFKSSRIKNDADMAPAADTYRHQLTLYRQALSRILRIGEDAIDMRILFTRVAKMYALPR
jgi:ATP-dependent exoDNAse (exonuclease V) beta subunit